MRLPWDRWDFLHFPLILICPDCWDADCPDVSDDDIAVCIVHGVDMEWTLLNIEFSGHSTDTVKCGESPGTQLF